MGTDSDGVVTGNTYDKYGSSKPVVKRLMQRFEAALDELLERAAPRRLLDVGCGEGVLAQRVALLFPNATIVAVDLDHPGLQAEWAEHGAPNLRYQVMDAGRLEYADGEFDVVMGIEVLEHVPHPAQALGEMARVARGGALILSVPREPLWRFLNVARGSYLRSFGNTPGHVNHWSRREFTAFASGFGAVLETRSPFPWTMVRVRV
jgi:2-polyprenyl-3-methyl-5-hydroxy-6-metoxy-1,4-benzoquinol methylase